jgi:phage portal protein BeeE
MLFDGISKRRQVFDGISKRRQVVPTQANPLLGLLGTDSTSKTGLDVDEETALESTGVWSAVTQLSQTIASLPLHLFKRTAAKINT